jgi:hypothetical protein
MLTKKRPHNRNRLDLTDRVQVRVVKRRLRISEPELEKLVGRMGNSIAAISKEVASRQSAIPVPPTKVPPAAVIEATRELDADPAAIMTGAAAG